MVYGDLNQLEPPSPPPPSFVPLSDWAPFIWAYTILAAFTYCTHNFSFSLIRNIKQVHGYWNLEVNSIPLLDSTLDLQNY
ncbi:hypothetical protein VNO78_07851 [Psophocarpus tetragonolobus]|uniref:Uncharacterized protein n=1 Tax=Psophocarpus tetragonolobus TaxID=3891 RepID=A0AAN9SW56_PSOTE